MRLLALVVLPPLMGLLVLAKSPELTAPTVLDHAQLARHLANGDGFVTSVLRPLSLALHPQASPHRDLVNAPVHPLLLAGIFSVVGPSGLAAVFCGCSVDGILAAAVGLPQPLLALLVLGTIVVIVPTPRRAQDDNFTLALWQPAVAGLLCGLAVLTDYRLLPLGLVVAVYLARTQERRGLAVALFVGGLVLVVAPWCVRNWMVSGRLFGLYWYGALENTRQYPGESIWRLTQAPNHPVLYLVAHPLELARKLAIGLVHYRVTGIGLWEPLILLLNVVTLFGAPVNSARRRLAGLAAASVVLTLLWSCLTRPDARLLLAWTPLLSCVAAAQLAVWLKGNVSGWTSANPRLRLSSRGMRGLAYAGVVALVVFPGAIQLGRSRTPAPTNRAALANSINQQLPGKSVVLTDSPSLMAWLLDRPALLICQREADLARLEQQAGPIAGIYLSPGIGALPERELGDWWAWVTSPRGIYRGLAATANPSLPGLLRLPAKPVLETAQWANLQRAVRESPQSAEAHVRWAAGLLRLGRVREASQEFQEAATLDPVNVEARVGLWQAFAEMRLADGTLRLAQLISQTSPQDPQIKPVLEQAAAHFEQVLKQAPDDPWVLMNLMVCHARLGQWPEVEASFTRLARWLPREFPSRLLLATLYQQQNEIAKAAAECAQLIEKHPEVAAGHQLAGLNWLAQGKPEEALRESVTAIRLRPQNASAYVQAAQACQRLKRSEEATDYLAKAIKLLPNQLSLKISLAEIYAAQEKLTETIGLYREILATDPKQPVVLNNLAFLLMKAGQTNDAVTFARQAVTLYPQSAAIRDTVGWVLFQAGDTDSASAHLREAIRLAPNQGIAHYHLAKVLLSQQRKEEALASLRGAIECGLPEVERQDAQKVLSGS